MSDYIIFWSFFDAKSIDRQHSEQTHGYTKGNAIETTAVSLLRFTKRNQAPHPKFERPNGKNTKSKFFLKSVNNWSVQLT